MKEHFTQLNICWFIDVLMFFELDGTEEEDTSGFGFELTTDSAALRSLFWPPGLTRHHLYKSFHSSLLIATDCTIPGYQHQAAKRLSQRSAGEERKTSCGQKLTFLSGVGGDQTKW